MEYISATNDYDYDAKTTTMMMRENSTTTLFSFSASLVSINTYYIASHHHIGLVYVFLPPI